jgi:hypothetical protein
VSLTFLSEEWLAALGEELSGSAPLEGEGSLRLGLVVVTDDGKEQCSYTLELVGGEVPRLLGAGTAEAEVVLVESAAAARSRARGAATSAELLEAGAIKIRGDARALVASAGLLEQVAKAAGGLARRTDFG